MTAATTTGRRTAGVRDVPATVRAGAETCLVTRTWPAGPDTLRLEGRDGAGRVRAGRLHLGRDGDGARAELAPYGKDPRLPALPAADGGEIVVHRLGRRAVVRHAEHYLKVVRPARGEELLHRNRVGADLARAAGFDAPRTTARGPGLVVMSVLPGVSLHGSGAGADDAGWQRAWDRLAERWLRFARPTGTPLPRRSAADEAATVTAWVDHALGHRVLEDPDGRLRAHAARVRQALQDGPGDPPVLAHRDLHDKQVLVAEDRVGLLDLDTVAVAEPALDLANLAAHARLREAQGLWTGQRRAVAEATVDALATATGVSGDRFAAYTAATELRLACLYAFRPRWQPLARAWAAALPDESALIGRSWSAHGRLGG